MPRSKKQYQNMVAERRDCIIKSALRVFALKGYNATGMDDISNEAKCSRTLIYHYYPTKEELFRNLMRYVANRIYAITESVDYSQTPDKSLAELLTKVLEKVNDNSLNCEYACMFYLILNLHLQGENIPKPKINKIDTPIGRQRLYIIINHLIESGQKLKIFSEGETKKFTIAILAMLNGLAYNKIFLKEKYTYPDVSMIMKIILKEAQLC